VRPLDLSNVSEAPFKLDSPPATNAALAAAAAAAMTSPGGCGAVTTSTGTSRSSNARRPILGTEYLDSASERLLATASARSSVAPVYTGYIWLFVPSEGLVLPDGFSLPTEEETASRVSYECDDVKEKQDTKPKAPGRFVKCFATINDQGHFHWVEVKKQNEIESEQDTVPSPTFNQRIGSALAGHSRGTNLTGGMPPMPASPTSSVASSHGGLASSSRPTYGVQLRPATKASTESPNPPVATDGDENQPLQILVARTKRMFCFCIKIKPSALSDVLLNKDNNRSQRVKSLATTTSDTSATAATVMPTTIHHHHQSPQQQLYRRSAPLTAAASNNPSAGASVAKTVNKVRHRLSSSLSTLTSAALPPLPHMKSQSLSGPSMIGPSINIGNGATGGDGKTQRHSGGHTFDNIMPLSSSVTDRITSAPPQLPPIASVSMSLSLSSSSLGSVSEGAGRERGGDSRRTILTSHKGSSHSLKSTVPSGASDFQHLFTTEEESSNSVPMTPPLPTRMTLSEVMEAKKGLVPDSAATMEQFKQLVQEQQQQIEQQQQSRYPQPALRNQYHLYNQQQQLSLDDSKSLASPSGESSPVSIEELKSPAYTCPFLEINRQDFTQSSFQGAEEESNEVYVTLKGYTETEEGWKILQNAFERFLGRSSTVDAFCALSTFIYM